MLFCHLRRNLWWSVMFRLDQVKGRSWILEAFLRNGMGRRQSEQRDALLLLRDTSVLSLSSSNNSTQRKGSHGSHTFPNTVGITESIPRAIVNVVYG